MENGFHFLRRLAQVEQSEASLRENTSLAIWVLALATRQLAVEVTRLHVGVLGFVNENALTLTPELKAEFQTAQDTIRDLVKHLGEVVDAYEPPESR